MKRSLPTKSFSRPLLLLLTLFALLLFGLFMAYHTSVSGWLGATIIGTNVDSVDLSLSGNLNLGADSELAFTTHTGAENVNGTVWWDGTNFKGYTGSAAVQLDNAAGGGGSGSQFTRNFTVASGSSVTAGQLLGFYNGTVSPGYGSSVGSTPTVFRSSFIQSTLVTMLDSTHFVVYYGQGAVEMVGSAVVGVFSGGATSFGAPVEFSSNMSHASISALDATHFVVAYNDGGNSNYGTAVVGVTNGATTISSFGTPVVFESAISQYISATALNATHFVVAYKDQGNSNYGTSVVGVTDGATAISSFGTPVVFESAETRYISATALDSTHFAVAYSDYGNFVLGTAVVGVTDGATAISSFGTPVVLDNTYTTETSIADLDATHFVVAYKDGGTGSGSALVGVTDGGTTISSFGTTVIFDATATYLSASVLDATHFVVAYQDGGNSGYGTAIVGVTDGATAISSFGAGAVFESATTSYTSVAALDATHFAVAYIDGGNSSYGTGIVLEVTGSTTIGTNSGFPLGIAAASAGSGSTVSVIVDGISDAHTGLTAGSDYYAATNGTVSTTSSSIMVGSAISSTEIFLKDFSAYFGSY